MKDEYSTFDIVRALEIQREKLKDWMTQGFIKPSVPAPGQGRKAIFTRLDVYGVGLFQRLIELGFKRKMASEFVNGFMPKPRAEKTKYILFRYFREENGYGIAINTFEESENIDLRTGGMAVFSGFNHKSLKGVAGDENWEQVVLINFLKLKQDIDIKLEGL